MNNYPFSEQGRCSGGKIGGNWVIRLYHNVWAQVGLIKFAQAILNLAWPTLWAPDLETWITSRHHFWCNTTLPITNVRVQNYLVLSGWSSGTITIRAIEETKQKRWLFGVKRGNAEWLVWARGEVAIAHLLIHPFPSIQSCFTESPSPQEKEQAWGDCLLLCNEITPPGWSDRLSRRVLTARTVVMRLCLHPWYGWANYPSLLQYLWSGGKAAWATSLVPACSVWGVGSLCHPPVAADGRCFYMPLQQGPCSYRLAPSLGKNVSSQINTCLII